MPFEVVEHTADLKIKVWGNSLENLFSEAMLAMMGKIKILPFSPIGEKGIIRREIKVEALDATALLVDFLSEVLALSQTNKEIYTEVSFTEFNPSTDSTSSLRASSGQAKLEATLKGIKVDKFDEDVKAVTYHEVEVKEVKSGAWETLLVFDI